MLSSQYNISVKNQTIIMCYIYCICGWEELFLGLQLSINRSWYPGWISRVTLTCLYLLSSRCLQNLRPFSWIKEFCCEWLSEVPIRKHRWVVVFHKGCILGFTWTKPGYSWPLPVLPEPLWSKRWYRKHTPMNKYAKLCLVIPARQRAWVQWLPVWGVFDTI